MLRNCIIWVLSKSVSTTRFVISIKALGQSLILLSKGSKPIKTFYLVKNSLMKNSQNFTSFSYRTSF